MISQSSFERFSNSEQWLKDLFLPHQNDCFTSNRLITPRLRTPDLVSDEISCLARWSLMSIEFKSILVGCWRFALLSDADTFQKFQLFLFKNRSLKKVKMIFFFWNIVFYQVLAYITLSHCQVQPELAWKAHLRWSKFMVTSVTHPSPIHDRRCSTALIGRERVHSTIQRGWRKQRIIYIV